MGCTLAKTAKIDYVKDAERQRGWEEEYGSEDSIDEDAAMKKSKWNFGSGRGHEVGESKKLKEWKSSFKSGEPTEKKLEPIREKVTPYPY